MFEAKMSRPELLVEGIKAVYELVKDDVVFKLGKDGLLLRAMDPANVAMVIMSLKKEAFDEYLLESEGFVGVNIERFIQVLKRVKRSEELALKISGGRIELISKGRGQKKFSLPLLALESGPRPEPNLSFSAKATVELGALQDAIDDASVVGDALTFVAANGELRVLSQGDLGDVEVVLRREEGLVGMEAQESARAKFSIEYLKKLTKPRVAKEVELALKTDYPLAIKHESPELELAFILAPRMDVE